MTSENATAEYIEFLFHRGCISHVVSASPNAPISTLALTQRCLASGIPFPVPLPDGSVGVKVENGIPTALAALDLVIEEVPIGHNEAASEEIAPMQLSPDDPGDNLAAVHDTTQNMAEAPEATEQHLEPADPDLDTTHSQGNPSEDYADDLHSAAQSDDTFEDPELTEPTMFVRSGARTVVEAVEPTVEQTGLTSHETDTSVCEDVDTGFADEAIGGIAETEAVEVDGAPGEVVADIGEADNDQVVELLAGIEERVANIVAQQSAIAEQIAAFSVALKDIASRPVPRPDTSEFNRGMAKMTAAFAHTLRRIEYNGEVMQAAQDKGGADIAACLADGFGSLAEAIRVGSPASVGASTELTMIATMQETLSHQLATLIEAQPMHQPPALEEFLLDLRHATAELLAEQTRVLQAG